MWFQFQNGAIKRQKEFPITKLYKSFNSKMVRLKEEVMKMAEAAEDMFQFQNGAIKRNLSFG